MLYIQLIQYFLWSTVQPQLLPEQLNQARVRALTSVIPCTTKLGRELYYALYSSETEVFSPISPEYVLFRRVVNTCSSFANLDV